MGWSWLSSSRWTVIQQKNYFLYAYVQPLPYFTHRHLLVSHRTISLAETRSRAEPSLQWGSKINAYFASLFEQQVKLEGGWNGFWADSIFHADPEAQSSLPLSPHQFRLFQRTKGLQPRDLWYNYILWKESSISNSLEGCRQRNIFSLLVKATQVEKWRTGIIIQITQMSKQLCLITKAKSKKEKKYPSKLK